MSSKRIRYGWKQAVIQFLKTTTLHGFKYLSSNCYMDRVGWLVCCCVSSCCAALLCTVLWRRFLEVPELLVLADKLPYDSDIEHIPDFTVCPPVETVARAFVASLSNTTNNTDHLPGTIARLLGGKKPSYDQIRLLDEVLSSANTTLTEAMYKHMPPCEQLVVKCRLQDVVAPCALLFVKENTTRGACCVMRSHKIHQRLIQNNNNPVGLAINVELALQCSNNSTLNGCVFITKFKGEKIEEPAMLFPGFNYMAQLHFESFPLPTDDNWFHSDCNSEKLSCECLSSCKKVTSVTNLDYNTMNAFEHAIDPIYKGLNALTSTVLFFRVVIEHSRVFTVIPTETWFTLLSSLGGVFNMFLGVGLFSAIEILFFIFFKLPYLGTYPLATETKITK